MSVGRVTDFWDKRYAEQGYAYGNLPNMFFKSVVDRLPVGDMLIPAAGQGRDAVYAATQGWQVDAFDLSAEGQKAALQLAKQKNVTLNFDLCNAFTFTTNKKYNAIASIYFHIPPVKRVDFHKKLTTLLAPQGVVIVEAFNKKQIKNNSGGPKDIDMLMSVDELLNDFSALQCIECYETVVNLQEGKYHVGNAEIIRYIGKYVL